MRSVVLRMISFACFVACATAFCHSFHTGLAFTMKDAVDVPHLGSRFVERIKSTELRASPIGESPSPISSSKTPLKGNDRELNSAKIGTERPPTSQEATKNSTKSTESPSQQRKVDAYDLPWTEMQEYALRDQLPRYVVQVPVSDSATKKETIKAYALWRTLSSEVFELSGYPIPFLVDRQKELYEKGELPLLLSPLTDILPYLDEFEFTSNGGLSGRVYGVAGVADGTRIETTPVGSVQVTVPKGFVRTEDGLLYELGRPVREAYSLDGSMKGLQQVADSGRDLASSLSKSRSSGNSPISNVQDSLLDPDLTQLGALTAFVIGGALAVESLSHHLTVNVFWV